MSERNKTPTSKVKTWFDKQPKKLAKKALIAAAKNHEWPTIKYVDISDQNQSESGHRKLIYVKQSKDKKVIAICYNKEALSKYGYEDPASLIHNSIKSNLIKTTIQPRNNKTHIITCEKQSVANDQSENVLYFEIGGGLKGYRLKYTFITKEAKEAYVNNLTKNMGAGVHFIEQNVISYNPQHKPRTKTVVIKPPKNNSFSPMNLPIPSQQQQGRTYNVRIEERKHDQNGNPIPQQQSPNTPYPFNQNNPNGTFNSYQPVEGERGSLQWEIKKVGANAFFPTTYTYGDFTFDANVAYQHNKNRKKCPALPSLDANSHPLFRMIHGVLKTVLTEEELKTVTYEKKDGRTKIYLPKSAHDKGNLPIYMQYYGDYSEYINKVIEDTKYAATPCQPKSKKDLIWFAINRIKADYKSAYYYYNKGCPIDSDLADYAKFKRNKLDGGNLLENIVYSDIVNGVYLNKFFGGKVDVSKLRCECKSYNSKDDKQHTCTFITGHQVILDRDKGFNQMHTNVGSQAKEIRDDTSSVYNDTDSLLPLYENGIITEGTLTRLKTSLFGDSIEPIDVPDEMLMVYENAAQLAALDNKAFPSKDETTNRKYLTHAYQYTLFKLNGKKLREYVTLKEKSKTILPEREFNPYLHIGYNSGIPPEKQIRHMVLDEAAIGGKVITREEMADRLYIFAFTEQPLECGLMVEPYDDDLMTAYVSLVNETVPVCHQDWYIEETRRRTMARMALKKKYEGHTTIESFQKLGQAFKNLSQGSSLDSDSLEAKIQAQIIAPYDAYILPTLEEEQRVNGTNQKFLRFSRTNILPIIGSSNNENQPNINANQQNNYKNLMISATRTGLANNSKVHLQWGPDQQTRYMNVKPNPNDNDQIIYTNGEHLYGPKYTQGQNHFDCILPIDQLPVSSTRRPYSPKTHGITIQSVTNRTTTHANIIMNDTALPQTYDIKLERIPIYVIKSTENLFTVKIPYTETAIQCSAEIAWKKRKYLPIRIKESDGSIRELGKVDVTDITNKVKEIGGFEISNNDKITDFKAQAPFQLLSPLEYSQKEINNYNELGLDNIIYPLDKNYFRRR